MCLFVPFENCHPSLIFVGKGGAIHSDKHSSLLRHGINYSRKKFYGKGRGCHGPKVLYIKGHCRIFWWWPTKVTKLWPLLSKGFIRGSFVDGDDIASLDQRILKGKYHCTVDLLFEWFGISSMTTDNFCFCLQNRLIQTSQTGGQWYSDTSPFSFPWLDHCGTA